LIKAASTNYGEISMAFYLLQASYTADAIKALVASPQDREADVRAITEALGGTLHQVFFAFGESDIVAIMEISDDKTMAAGSFVASATGAFSKVQTTKLLTTAEAMEAMNLAKATAGAYKPPTG
tara:strand:+ start:781 stop:1152 length:372 start_codon:yes stop_codon:yes gene_type:complete